MLIGIWSWLVCRLTHGRHYRLVRDPFSLDGYCWHCLKCGLTWDD